MLALALLLGMMGDGLFGSLAALVRESTTAVVSERGELLLGDAGPLARAAGNASAVGARLGLIGLGALASALATHLIQTGGLWAPARLAPDVSRLWAGMLSLVDEERAGGWAGRAGRGVWSGVRTVSLLVAGGIFLVWQGPAAGRLGTLDGTALARGAGSLMQQLGVALALVWVVLGLIDYAMQVRRFEARLRMTPEEQREENRAIDGDPAIRSRRLQLARSWLRDPGELLAGASVVLAGKGGLAVLLAGGPPPGRIIVRTIARGVSASTLRHGAERAGVPVVRAAELAAWFARGGGRRTLPEDIALRLGAVWPGGGGT
jgi:flagellar biosynthetic protein FlhB